MRRRLLRAPLWARLVAGTLLLVALALIVTGLAGTQILRGSLIHRVDQQLKSSTRLHPPPPGVQLPDTGLRARRFPQVYALAVGADGKVVDERSDPFSDDRPKLPPLTKADVARLGTQPFTVDSATGGGHWRVLVTPLDDGTTRVVAVSLADIGTTVSQVALIDASVGAVVLLFLAVLGFALVRASLRPLVEIEDTAEKIAAGDLSRRVPDRDVPTEVGRLGGALNGMLAQIESAFRDRETSEAAARRSEDRMRAFVADASHELRTPLTSIRGFAELYRQEGADDPETAKLLRRIEDEANRMGLLVEDLLLLARLDQQRPLESRPVDLLSLAAGAVLDAQDLAPDREIDLVRVDGADSPVVVIGDEVRLRQVLANLITNVLAHTPAGTPFLVGVGVTDRGIVLEVADQGPGLPADRAERVFERFYRAEPSRSRAYGGSGLGLSIVAALVHAHGGTIELETAPGQGALFRVLLPA